MSSKRLRIFKQSSTTWNRHCWSDPTEHTQEYNRTRTGKHRRQLVEQRTAQSHRRQHLHQAYGQLPTASSTQSGPTSYSSIAAPSSLRSSISRWPSKWRLLQQIKTRSKPPRQRHYHHHHHHHHRHHHHRHHHHRHHHHHLQLIVIITIVSFDCYGNDWYSND